MDVTTQNFENLALKRAFVIVVVDFCCCLRFSKKSPENKIKKRVNSVNLTENLWDSLAYTVKSIPRSRSIAKNADLYKSDIIFVFLFPHSWNVF